MASFGCNVRLSRFRWSRAGYAAVMDSVAVRSLVRDNAESVKSAADSLTEQRGYSDDSHEVKPFAGKLTHGYVVRTNTDHARAEQARNKTLEKALHSAGGGA